MDDTIYLDLLGEMCFDDLPGDLQDSIATLADKEQMSIDEMWLEIRYGDYVLPRYLDRPLRVVAKRHVTGKSIAWY